MPEERPLVLGLCVLAASIDSTPGDFKNFKLNAGEGACAPQSWLKPLLAVSHQLLAIGSWLLCISRIQSIRPQNFKETQD